MMADQSPHSLNTAPTVVACGAGVRSQAEFRLVRELARCLGAEHESEIVFTSGGTESDNTAVRSALMSRRGRRRVITTRVEHPAVLNLAKHLQNKGYRVTFLSVDRQGMLDLDEL